jgi:hypothetical protein
VDNFLWTVALKNFLHRPLVANVGFEKDEVPLLFRPPQVSLFNFAPIKKRVKIVNTNNKVAPSEQPFSCVRADKTGAACNQNGRHLSALLDLGYGLERLQGLFCCNLLGEVARKITASFLGFFSGGIDAGEGVPDGARPQFARLTSPVP